MKRAPTVILLSAATLAALAAALLSGLAYARARRADAAITGRALATLYREARAPRETPDPEPATARVCPENAEGLAVAARRALGVPIAGARGAVDPAAIAAISNGAIAAARYLERARGAPALPQRLGRELSAGGWGPIVPEPSGCATIWAPPPEADSSAKR